MIRKQMKKLLILLCICSLSWMAYLSYDVFKIAQQQQDLVKTVEKIEQLNLSLNDQLVSIERSKSNSNEKKIASNETSQEIAPQDLLKQQFDLIDFALQQKQYQYALQRLMTLDTQIENYALAPSLLYSLKQVIAKDIENIKQIMVKKEGHNQKILQVLNTIDQQIQQQIQHPQLKPNSQEQPYFWQNWFKLEPANQPSVQLMNRGLILKETQLRLLIAKQAMLNDQNEQYQIELDEAIHLLNQLPDQQAKEIQEKIKLLKKLGVVELPILETKRLIG